MADTILDKLKNKVTYRVKKSIDDAVHDPEADAYAKKKKAEKEQEEEDKEKENETEDTFKAKQTKPKEPTDQSTWGKVKRIMNKVLGRLSNIFFNIILPLLMASLVANESIMYPVPVRVAFFIFTLVLCVTSAAALGIMTMFYMGKAFYHYYVNVMEKRSVYQRIIPTIFSLLPITRYQPTTNIGSFFIYPFRYPKTDKDERDLVAIMDEYLETLKGTFTYLDQLKSIPIFEKGASKVEELLEHMHDKPPARAPVVQPEAPVVQPDQSLPPVISESVKEEPVKPSAPPMPVQ